MKRTISLALALCAMASTGIAQVGTSEVLGTVRDASHSVVSKAVVTLTSTDTAISAKTTTDTNGEYDFLNVNVGRYSLTVEATGFAKSTTDLAVDVNARQRVDISMQVGVVTDSVNVSGAVAALETDTSEHSQVINTAASRRTAAERPQLCRPGAALHQRHQVADGRFLLAPAARRAKASFNVNGMRSTYNNFLLDGLDNNSYGTSNQGYSSQVVQPSPDALAEFKVITSNYSAEYGRVGGAVVNAVMKSGHQPVSRHRVRVSAQYRSERHRLPLQPRGLREAHAAAQSVRRHHRRTHHQEQAVLLRRLRGLPPIAALSQFRFHPERHRPRRAFCRCRW